MPGWLLDAIHVIVVVVVAAAAAVLITGAWAPRVVIFGLLVAVLAFPVKRLLDRVRGSGPSRDSRQ